MVGIVIVSHSAKLASGVQELAQQMVQGTVALATAAGIDDAENPFGTNAMQVYQAIESVYSDDGVVVLMDLGSAVLSAEMALEFLPEEKRYKVRLCEAPLVEGTIAAVVQAANGASIEQVIAEARGALAAKAAQLFGVTSQSSVISDNEQLMSYSEQNKPEIHLIIQNPMGLHARPAAKFVATASRFQSDITVRNVTAGSESVNAKSINQVVILGVRQGDEIAIAATGTDADAALAALQHLVETNFREKIEALLPSASIQNPKSKIQNSLSGIPASPGIAIGRLLLYHSVIPEIGQQPVKDPQTEWQQLQTAIQSAHDEIELLRQQAAIDVGEETAAIFDAQMLCLADPNLLETAHQKIFDYRLSAADAWKVVIACTVRTYEALKDPYLQARSADVQDVGQRVLRLLTGVTISPLELAEPAILVTTDLTPSETAQLDPTKILGICTVKGGATSHAAILARSLGIPAVMGVGANLLQLENNTLIALDGETGLVWVNPDNNQLSELNNRQNIRQATIQASKATARQPAITADGYRVKLMANICGIADARIAVDAGAEGVGLLRSEFLYFDRTTPPTEEEQLQVYDAIAQILSPHPLIIRILDIGGDKPLPYLNLPPEPNPFLGYRGIRLLLDRPDLLQTQLRAILRASHQHPIKIMFPAIASVKEIRAAKEILAAAQTQLRQAGIPFDEKMAVGIMVEVPAAAVMADKLAAEVDFFSIGTNDLSQYVMAADRNHPIVATLADGFEPAVLRMIQQTVTAAREAGICVGVCGELASYPEAIPILLGLGVDELSMNLPAIPDVKAMIARMTMGEMEAIASTVLQLDSATAVKEYVVQKTTS
jgi:multiphosphoryl transfer protein